MKAELARACKALGVARVPAVVMTIQLVTTAAVSIPENVPVIYLHPEFALMAEAIPHGLLYVFGHELGHVVNGHLHPAFWADVKTRELEADFTAGVVLRNCNVKPDELPPLLTLPRDQKTAGVSARLRLRALTGTQFGPIEEDTP